MSLLAAVVVAASIGVVAALGYYAYLVAEIVRLLLGKPLDQSPYEVPDALELDPRLQSLARAALAFHDDASNRGEHRNHV